MVEVELRHYSDGNADCPVVRFTTRLGQTMTHFSDICSWPSDYEVGQQAGVYYDERDPERVQLDNFFGVWFLPLLFGFMGLIFGGVGFFSLFRNLLPSRLLRRQ